MASNKLNKTLDILIALATSLLFVVFFPFLLGAFGSGIAWMFDLDSMFWGINGFVLGVAAPQLFLRLLVKED